MEDVIDLEEIRDKLGEERYEEAIKRAYESLFGKEETKDRCILRRNRMRHNLTQQQLADKLGVSITIVGYWERGGRPNTTNAQKISEILGGKAYEYRVR